MKERRKSIIYFMRQKRNGEWEYIDILTYMDTLTPIIRRYENLGWTMIDIFWGYKQAAFNNFNRIILLHGKKYRNNGWEIEISKSKSIIQERLKYHKEGDNRYE